MGHDPTEHAQEHITHEAAHGHGPKWITWAAMTAAIIAAFAAVTGAAATKHLTESTQKRIDSNNIRIKANDNWNFYQAKSIKTSIIDSRLAEYELADPAKMTNAFKKQHTDDLAKKEYATKPEEDDKENPKGLKGIQEKAQGYEEESKALEGVSAQHLDTHETYEMAATMFHIAIAVVAISVVAKRKEFWYMSMVGGVVGLYFVGMAMAHAPAAEPKEAPEATRSAAEKPGEHGPAKPGEHAPAETGHAASQPASSHAPSSESPHESPVHPTTGPGPTTAPAHE